MTDETRQRILYQKIAIWITRGARFNASRRLTDRVSNLGRLHAVSATTLVVTGVLVSQASSTTGEPLLGALAAASVSILGMTLLATQLSTDTYKAKSDSQRLHADGQRMSLLLDALATLLVQDPDDERALQRLDELTNQYREIESGSSANHDPRDMHYFLASKNVPHNWGAEDLARVNTGQQDTKMHQGLAIWHRVRWHIGTSLTILATISIPASQLLMLLLLYSRG